MMHYFTFLIALAGIALTALTILRVRHRKEFVPQPVLGKLTSAAAYAIPMRKKGEAELKKDLIRGGYLHDCALINFLATRNVAFFIWIIFIVASFTLELVQPGKLLVGGAVGIAISIFAAPRIWIGMHSSSRARRICHDLPDALDLLAMMMSGGMTMQDSLNHVIGEFDDSHRALASELQITARHARTGSLDSALISFADRLDIPEVTALTAMLRGGHRAGGSLVDALRSFSDGLRYERDQKAKERGNTASVKLLLPVIFCLAPPIYILLLGPAFLNLKDFIEKENQPGGALSPTVQVSQVGSAAARSARADSFSQNR